MQSILCNNDGDSVDGVTVEGVTVDVGVTDDVGVTGDVGSDDWADVGATELAEVDITAWETVEEATVVPEPPDCCPVDPASFLLFLSPVL